MTGISIAAACVGAIAAAGALVLAREARRAARTPRVLCLMYHRFAERERWRKLRGLDRVFTLPADALDAQLGWLAASGHRFVRASEVARFADGRAELPDLSVLVTVDDGCVSAHQSLLPTLRKYDAHAIVFVTTDPTASIFSSGERRMTDEEIRELAEAGVEIGSHAVSHRPLTAMSDGEIRKELIDSKATLERITGMPVRHFAVPSNWYDDRVLRLARESGYEAVFCSRPGTVAAGDGRFGIPRLNVEGDVALDGFRLALSPREIAVRRVVLAIRGLPKRAVGPEHWVRMRRSIFRSVPADWLSPSRMARVLVVLIGIAVVGVVSWIALRG